MPAIYAFSRVRIQGNSPVRQRCSTLFFGIPSTNVLASVSACKVVLHCRLAVFGAAGSLAYSSSMSEADQGTLTIGVHCTEVATRQGCLTWCILY